jgi:hypothetical protein
MTSCRGHDAFQHLAFVIDSALKEVRHPVDFRIDLVQMPLSEGAAARCLEPLAPDLNGEHRIESVPPVLHRFVVYLDATLIQEVLDIAQ